MKNFKKLLVATIITASVLPQSVNVFAANNLVDSNSEISYDAELINAEPKVYFQDGILHFENITLEDNGKEFVVENKDKSNLIQSRFFFNYNRSDTIQLTTSRGSSAGFIDVNYKITYQDGYGEYMGFTPTSVRVRLDGWSSNIGQIKNGQVSVTYWGSSYVLNGYGTGYDEFGTSYSLSGSVTKY